MSFDGHLDSNDGWTIFGWAYDARHPDDSVEVEFFSGASLIGIGSADQFRPDLKNHGLGNGFHAFSFTLPLPPVGARWEDPIAARIKGTDFMLKDGPQPLQRRPAVELVAGDIVNNCNLRCPFCIVDYANVKGLKFMTPETFAKASELLPITKPGNFWLSCLHEPTLNPKFVDFIEGVPFELRNRISFTTNLARKLPDEYLERLANSGVHSIRISFDSRDPNVFAELRRGARYENFEDNLTRLARFLGSSPRRPLLHFISMAFKDNYKELPELIKYGRGLGGNLHEVRFIYYVPHVAHWGKDHILSDPEWDELDLSLRPLGETGHLEVAGPVRDTRQQFDEERGLAQYVARESAFGGSGDSGTMEPSDPFEVGAQIPDEALRIRLRWDGVAMLEQLPEDTFKVNINQLGSVDAYFEKIRVGSRFRAVAQ